MKRAARAAACACLLAAAFAGCGKKGGILPPIVLVPQKSEELKAEQWGAVVRLELKLPAAYIDGRPIDGPVEVEVWLEAAREAPAGEAAPAFDPGAFLSRAKRLAVLGPVAGKEAPAAAAGGAPARAAKKPRPVSAEPAYVHALGPDDLSAARLVFAVRTRDVRRKRESELSDPAALVPVAVAQPPGAPRVAVTAAGIELSWDAPRANIDGTAPASVAGYAVYRSEAEGPAARISEGPLSEAAFVDRRFQFGTSYAYVVRALTTARGLTVESEASTPAVIVARDSFPPPAPGGLTAVAGAGLIALSWEASAAPDAAGYRVWRRPAGEAEFSALTPSPIAETAYADASAAPLVRYEYAVTAVDKAGNESPRSASVFETIKR